MSQRSDFNLARIDEKGNPILVYDTRDVFVAGRQPTVTYNPRNERQLEREVRTYVAQPGKALSISGPTKSGKTVLIDRLLPPDRAIWIQGSDLDSIDSFWRSIVDALDAFDEVSDTRTHSTTQAGSRGVELGVPHAIHIDLTRSGEGTRSRSRTGTRTRPIHEVAREALAETPYPIVVDDFHYVSSNVKRAVARAVKTLIGVTHVILIAVPHEAFEAVRAEPDMDGRVWQLRIEHWGPAELRYIARVGFEALNIVDEEELTGHALANASFGAPFLMQQLCYDYSLSERVVSTARSPVPATQPGSWPAFFRQIADRSVPGVFDRLCRGPNPRGQQRVDRITRDGRTTDIYGAILLAISKSGSKTTLRPSEILRTLEQQVVHNVPTRQQIAASLGHMRDIAMTHRGSGDAALDFKNDELHMLDPFLSFYLRYGSWSLPAPADLASPQS